MAQRYTVFTGTQVDVEKKLGQLTDAKPILMSTVLAGVNGIMITVIIQHG
jgi:hypothetical protein